MLAARRGCSSEAWGAPARPGERPQPPAPRGDARTGTGSPRAGDSRVPPPPPRGALRHPRMPRSPQAWRCRRGQRAPRGGRVTHGSRATVRSPEGPKSPGRVQGRLPGCPSRGWAVAAAPPLRPAPRCAAAVPGEPRPGEGRRAEVRRAPHPDRHRDTPGPLPRGPPQGKRNQKGGGGGGGKGRAGAPAAPLDSTRRDWIRSSPQRRGGAGRWRRAGDRAGSARPHGPGAGSAGTVAASGCRRG